MPVFIWVLAVAAAASTAPRVVNHPPIRLRVDQSAFTPSRTGCRGTKSSPATLTCGKGTLADLGCEWIDFDDDLGGLTLPTARCWKVVHGTMPASEYIHGPRGMMPVYERLVVLDHGHYRLIKNMPDLRRELKPVTSEAQALSTAIAVMGVPPAHGSKVVPGFRYFVSTLEDTFVTRERDDFVVHNLQEYTLFGCGPHTTYLVTVRVPRNGEVSQVSRIRAFEDPAKDGLCVD